MPSIVARVPLALSTADFKHAQSRRQEWASTQVGHDIPQTSSTREEELDLGADPPESDGIHPEEGPNSRHRRKLFAHILHPPSPRNAPTPTPLCLFLFTGPTPLALAHTHAHERRQLFQLVGRMEWHISRLARLIVFGPHANRAGHRRAGHKRRPQATRSTKADDGHDEEEITQNRDVPHQLPRATLLMLPWSPSSWRANGKMRQNAPKTKNSRRRPTLKRPTTTLSDAHSRRPKRLRNTSRP